MLPCPARLWRQKWEWKALPSPWISLQRLKQSPHAGTHRNLAGHSASGLHPALGAASVVSSDEEPVSPAERLQSRLAGVCIHSEEPFTSSSKSSALVVSVHRDVGQLDATAVTLGHGGTGHISEWMRKTDGISHLFRAGRPRSGPVLVRKTVAQCTVLLPQE